MHGSFFFFKICQHVNKTALGLLKSYPQSTCLQIMYT